MLKILFQILIFTLFIIGNGYQSVITNFMMNPMQISHIESLDELFDSNLKIVVPSAFHLEMSNNSKYQNAFKDGRVLLDEMKDLNKAKPFGISILCDGEYKIANAFNRTGYYKLSYTLQKTKFLTLNAGIFNPLFNNLQNLILRCFEFGLIKVWKENFKAEVKEGFRTSGRTIYQPVEKNRTLDLSQILPICVVLLIGHGFALLSFLCEIFYHDFLSKLGYFSKKFKKNRVKKMTIVVRKVQVASMKK